MFVFLTFCVFNVSALDFFSQSDSLKKAQVDSLLALGAGKLSVKTHTPDEIRGFIRKNPILSNGVVPNKYIVQPRVKQPFAQGELNSEFIARGINAINVVRYIAGIDAVELDASKLSDCQAAALMCAATKADKGTPKIPDGMKKDFFKGALQTYSNSKLAVGNEQLDRTIIYDCVRSASKDEVADVCNRRELLNPALQKLAFGHVGKYALLNITGTKADVSIENSIVAWPAQNTPLDYFDVGSPLSLMFNGDYDVKGNVVLVMVRLHDGKVWKFGRLLPKQDGYYSTSTLNCGMPNCIIWKPDIDQYRANDQFSIHVSGVKFRGVELPTIEYTVRFFNLFTVFVNGYLNIMDPISSINGNDFKGNKDIVSVDIAKSVKTIEKSAFLGCINLEQVNLPESFEIIQNSVFKGCIALKSIKLPNTVTQIEGDAFAGCSGLTSVGISYKLQKIETSAFKGCSQLSSIDFPQSLVQIGVNAFSECTALQKIQIPLNVKFIGTGAFAGCSSLKSVVFEESEQASVDLSAHVFSLCISLDSISIPGSVKTIEEYAFDGCSNLKVIRISEGVTKIADNAFTKTPLQRIYIPSSVQSIGRVSAIPSTATIYCKAGSFAEKWAKSLFRKYELIH